MSDKSLEALEQRIRDSAPLTERIKDSKTRIGKMCKEGRPPHMTIPAQWNDDDMFICTTLSDADKRICELESEKAALSAQVDAANNLVWHWRKWAGGMASKGAAKSVLSCATALEQALALTPEAALAKDGE